jgi:poly-gamma-glutamate capsule biosynthesis protein CapA/YwtB (metallophosphatase superfamily)
VARIILLGDVMTGRAVDSILRTPSAPYTPHPGSRTIGEMIRDAEGKNGPIPRGVDAAYVWGEARAPLAAMDPSVRIANLETAITRSPERQSKRINYRMDPANVEVLRALPIDCCTLANNHTLDWGRQGLTDTLDALDGAGIARTGAGRSYDEAWKPAYVPTAEGSRILVVGMAHGSSGIGRSWAAGPATPGIALLDEELKQEVRRLAELVRAHKSAGDIAVASIHAGPNWSFRVAPGYALFARALIEVAGFDVVHGHSSHHLAPLGFHRRRPVLFGCGDFINDYEGRDNPPEYNHTFAAAYCLDTTDLSRVEIKLFQIKKFRLERAGPADCARLAHMLSKCSAPFRTHFSIDAGNSTIVAAAP